MRFGEEHAPPFPAGVKAAASALLEKLVRCRKKKSSHLRKNLFFSAAEQEKVGTADRAAQWQETGPGQRSSAACEATQHGVLQEFFWGGKKRCDEPDRWVSEL